MAESEMAFEGLIGTEWCCGRISSVQYTDLWAEGTTRMAFYKDSILKFLFRVGMLSQICEGSILDSQFIILNV